MIEELGALNEKFYLLCSRLDKYCEKLSDEQYAFMQAVLLAQYRDEYTLLALKCGIETKREIDELQAKHDRLVPQRWRTRWLKKHKQNYAATLNDAKADEFAAREFAAIEAQIEAETRVRCDAEMSAETSADGPAEEPTDSVETLAETSADGPAEEPAEGADSAADGAGDVSDASMSDENPAAEPSEGGATLEEIEAKIAQDAWEKLAANAESADPKQAKSDENADVPEITENGDK